MSHSRKQSFLEQGVCHCFQKLRSALWLYSWPSVKFAVSRSSGVKMNHLFDLFVVPFKSNRGHRVQKAF